MTDAEFLDAFESGALASFHHRDHLRMAWLYLQRDGVDAEASVLAGLRHFAEGKGASGLFHETLTRFWVRLVRHVAAAGRAAAFDDLFTIFPKLTDKSLPERHYSRDALWSATDRSSWVEPDLRPMP